MRLLLPAILVALVASASAFARPAALPVEAGQPFYAATPVAASVALHQRPGGRVLATVGTRTEFGSPETLGVARSRGNWVAVISTSLPNGVLGWVPRRELALKQVQWSVNVSLSQHLLVIRHGGDVVRTVTVGVGAPGSPTPTGRFVITDHIDPGAQSSVYGCCILALSGKQMHPPAGWSRTQTWRLAIHGGRLGAVSAGCIHADTTTLRLLETQTPLGTPVTISA
jgi:lipoprotein-anchoring transpeptidase ErfK/SrfK